MKRLLWLLPLALVAMGGAVWLKAEPFTRHSVKPALPVAMMQAGQPTIGNVTVTPNVIQVNAPTTVTVTAVLTAPNVVPNGIHLLRLNATGTPSTILGVMKDDGVNGDAAGNDNIFTLRQTFNDGTTGQVRLQVSVASRGLLKRITSQVHFLTVISSSNILGSDGGSLVLPGPVTVTIPKGTLLKPAQIIIQSIPRNQLPTTVPTQANVASAVALDVIPAAPADEAIAIPSFLVQLSVPLQAAQPPGTKLIVLTENSTTSNWARVGEAIVNSDGLSASFTVTDVGSFLLMHRGDLEKAFQ